MRFALFVPVAAWASGPPPGMLPHETSPADHEAIEAVLDGYTRAVSNGDEAAFARLILNEDIPFFSTYGVDRARSTSDLPDLHDYHGFRQAIFRNHQRFDQHFYNVRIEQDGVLAAATLDYVTLDKGTQHGGYGWKTLQLIKVAGEWKIASEIYSGHALREMKS